MQRKQISNSGRLETNERESVRTTVKAGRKSYLSKSSKASSQPRRRGNERASAGKKRQNDIHRQAFKLADFLTDETIKKLRGIK